MESYVTPHAILQMACSFCCVVYNVFVGKLKSNLPPLLMLSGDLAIYGDTRMTLQQYLCSFVLTVFANIGYMICTVSSHSQYIPLLALCQKLFSRILLMLLPV